MENLLSDIEDLLSNMEDNNAKFEIGFCKEKPSVLTAKKSMRWAHCFDKLNRERHARRFNNIGSISEVIRFNFDTIKSKDRSERGTVFELCVLDGLLRAGVNEARITMQESIAENVNVDLCIRPTRKGGMTFIVPCKTSCRERWKQWGFESAVIKFGNKNKYAPYRIVGVFYSEDNTLKSPNVKNAIKHQEKYRSLCIFIDDVITILDIARMEQFLRDVSRQ